MYGVSCLVTTFLYRHHLPLSRSTTFLLPLPQSFPPLRGREMLTIDVSAARRKIAAARRGVVWEMLREHPGDVPSVRGIAARLKRARGRGASFRTILQDRRAVLEEYRKQARP